MKDYFCLECNQPCDVIEETFSYAGTHCGYTTHGLPGIHKTGFYVSECCSGEYTDDDPQV